MTQEVWLYAIGSGFFVMLGHLFVFLSFRHASARTVAPFYYSFTLAAVAVGALLFQEYPNGWGLIGIADDHYLWARGACILKRGEDVT